MHSAASSRINSGMILNIFYIFMTINFRSFKANNDSHSVFTAIEGKKR